MSTVLKRLRETAETRGLGLRLDQRGEYRDAKRTARLGERVRRRFQVEKSSTTVEKERLKLALKALSGGVTLRSVLRAAHLFVFGRERKP